MASNNTDVQPLDLVWGVKAISRRINRNERQTFHLLNQGALPAKKVGGRWVASCADLDSALRAAQPNQAA